MSDPSLPANSSAETIASLAQAWKRLLSRLMPLVVLGAAVLGITLGLNHPERLPLYLVSAGPALLILDQSARQESGGLPVFPLYALLQALTFSSPLFSAEIAADRRVVVSPELLGSCVLPVLLWFVALWLGWEATPSQLGRRRPARALTDGLRNPGSLPHWSLALAWGLQQLLSSPLYWQLPSGVSQGLLTPTRTVINLAIITGAFTGAYAWSQGRLPRPWLWLGLFSVLLVGALSSLLLSSLQGMFFAALLGIWLGRSRQALPITLAGLLLLAFFHLGKEPMREMYWGGGARMPSNPLALVQQWTAVSLSNLTSNNDEESGNLFTARFNNLQNLLYVQQELASGTPPLGGDSLSVIPQILVPRILNTQRLRSHEGQVRLNLHFGRQRNIEDTERAYIAWGFLAEGVGNFGAVVGPLVMGMATGFLLRITTTIGTNQLILSAPGLLSFALTVFWLTSYEMAASTFVAAIVQIIVVVLLVGWWFDRTQAAGTRRFV